MKEERIIRALNDVDDTYILEAMPGRKAIRHISWKKKVCAVACLILMIALSTVAYAANWFGIRDLLLPLTNKYYPGVALHIKCKLFSYKMQKLNY